MTALTSFAIAPDLDTDAGMLLLRLALGPMLVAHGWNKVFGSGGLAGTTRWFEGLGLRPAWLHARTAAAAEIGAGGLVLLGLLVPLAAAAFVGLMTVAALTDHRGKGYFVFKGGNEYTVLVALVAPVLAIVGPGSWALDPLLGLDRFHGLWWGIGAAVLGVVAAGLLLIVALRRPAAAA